MEFDALLFGVVDLLDTSRHLLFGSSVDNDGFGSEPLGCSGRIHGDVTAAYDRHLLALLQGGVVTWKVIPTHEV